MRFQTVRLSESGVTDIAFIRSLTGVNPKMSFQFKRIWTGIGAVLTLKIWVK